MFRDRRDSGRQLASRLKAYEGRDDALVLALPRGGVSTGLEIARALRLPLDLLIVRKIGFPGQPELAIGAVSETGAVVLNRDIITPYGVTEKYIEDEIARQKAEIRRRVDLYRRGGRPPDLRGKAVILADDGVATGATMKAAIETLRKEDIGKLVAVLPVSPPETALVLQGMVDEFICLVMPSHFTAVGAFYDDFTQVSDEEVVEMLREAEGWAGHSG